MSNLPSNHESEAAEGPQGHEMFQPRAVSSDYKSSEVSFREPTALALLYTALKTPFEKLAVSEHFGSFPMKAEMAYIYHGVGDAANKRRNQYWHYALMNFAVRMGVLVVLYQLFRIWFRGLEGGRKGREIGLLLLGAVR
ncbi:hypothetical protein BDV96DRAFT_654066 [Lophiotrema nucula]|uniref:Uncharacterized protein n=1 Tax=Lophiotrema nucula TaxID=690887 RepID=A0A6A5YIZ0_9PLEO|nr:hypothetical protein BDV96DRAFT_654066 [Lophiotrema nucula]